jgi:hypothetical protein
MGVSRQYPIMIYTSKYGVIKMYRALQNGEMSSEMVQLLISLWIHVAID